MEVWPSSKMKRQSAACSHAMWMALGSPTLGSSTVLELYDIGGDTTITLPQAIDMRLFPVSLKPRKSRDEEIVASSSGPSFTTPVKKTPGSRPVVQSPSMRRSNRNASSMPSTSQSHENSTQIESNGLDEHHAAAVNDALFTISSDNKVSTVLQFLTYQTLVGHYIMEGNIVRVPIMGSDIIMRIENIHSDSTLARIDSASSIRFLQPGDTDANCTSSTISYATRAAEAAAKALDAAQDSPPARAAYLAARTGERSINTTTFASLGGLESQVRYCSHFVPMNVLKFIYSSSCLDIQTHYR